MVESLYKTKKNEQKVTLFPCPPELESKTRRTRLTTSTSDRCAPSTRHTTTSLSAQRRRRRRRAPRLSRSSPAQRRRPPMTPTPIGRASPLRPRPPLRLGRAGRRCAAAVPSERQNRSRLRPRAAGAPSAAPPDSAPSGRESARSAAGCSAAARRRRHCWLRRRPFAAAAAWKSCAARAHDADRRPLWPQGRPACGGGPRQRSADRAARDCAWPD